MNFQCKVNIILLLSMYKMPPVLIVHGFSLFSLLSYLLCLFSILSLDFVFPANSGIIYFCVLQKLQDSLKAVYGQTCEAESSDEVVDKFFEWKSTKLEEFRCVRSATDDSLERLLECFSRIITVKKTLCCLRLKTRVNSVVLE